MGVGSNTLYSEMVSQSLFSGCFWEERNQSALNNVASGLHLKLLYDSIMSDLFMFPTEVFLIKVWLLIFTYPTTHFHLTLFWLSVFRKWFPFWSTQSHIIKSISRRIGATEKCKGWQWVFLPMIKPLGFGALQMELRESSLFLTLELENTIGKRLSSAVL